MQMFMPMRGQDSFYTMASGGLGYSLPASVGMALGRPDRRTICLVGDGSAMYSIQALWTAAQRKLPLTAVVINNAGYGAMRSFSQVMQVRNVPGLDLPGIDFVRIAQGLGCDAVRVTKSSELAPELQHGLGHDGVSLIAVAGLRAFRNRAEHVGIDALRTQDGNADAMRLVRDRKILGKSYGRMLGRRIGRTSDLRKKSGS